MLIKIKVNTNSKEQNVERISSELFSEKGYEGLYLVRLKSSPIGGKANLELIKVLKDYFRKKVKIKSGFTSRNKVVELKD